MRTTILAVAIAAALPLVPTRGADDNVEVELLRLERQALDGWRTGNPEPQLAIVDPAITYIHSAAAPTRISGVDQLQKLYDRFRGTPLFDSYEITDPHVRTSGTTAILTYRLTRRNAAVADHWSATQVYERQRAGWRLVHSHWSEAKEQQP